MKEPSSRFRGCSYREAMRTAHSRSGPFPYKSYIYISRQGFNLPIDSRSYLFNKPLLQSEGVVYTTIQSMCGIAEFSPPRLGLVVVPVSSKAIINKKGPWLVYPLVRACS